MVQVANLSQHANQNLTWNSYSWSFTAMHLGSLRSQRGAAISCLITMALFLVSEEIATENAKKLPSSTTPLLFDVSPQETPKNICIYLVFPETRVSCLHLWVWIYLHSIFVAGSLKMHLVCNSAYRPFKVTDFGTNRKCVCNFQLVRHSNLGPILPYAHFRDVAGFLFRNWPHP